jgi:hypothetical protein
MTVYQLTKKIPDETLGRLIAAGIIRDTIHRNIEIYEAYVSMTETGIPAMQAYVDVSEKFCVSDEHVRSIVRKFCKMVS